MIIEFAGLSEEEKQLVFDFERKFPEQTAVRELVAGFDGATAMQLITEIAPEIVAGLFALATTLITLKHNKKDSHGGDAIIYIIFSDGKRVAVSSPEELKEKLENERA